MEGTDGTPRPAHASPSRMSESTRGAVVTTPPYEEFYRTNFDHLVATLALTLGNLDLAKDAAAEAMTRASQRWNEVATYANPQGWTYRVGLNWARSWFRKRRRELSGVYVDNGAEDPPVADPHSSEPSPTCRSITDPSWCCATTPTGRSSRSPKPSRSPREP